MLIDSLAGSPDLELVAIVFEPEPDGMCRAESLSAAPAIVGCDSEALRSSGAGTLVVGSTRPDFLDAVLGELSEDHVIDLVLADSPASRLPVAAGTITVIPVSATGDGVEEMTYPELVALVLSDETMAIYEVIDTAAGPARFVAALRLDPGAESPKVDEALEVAEPEVVWAFDLATTAQAPGLHSQSAVVDGVVHFLGFDGVVYAVDASSGVERWRQAVVADTRGVPLGSFTAVSDGAVVVSLAAERGLVRHRAVVGLDASTGEILWQRVLPQDGLGGQPLVVDDRVVLWWDDEGEPALVALDPRSGAELWSSPPSDSPGAGPLRLVDGRIHAGTIDGTILTVDAATGVERGRFSLDAPFLVGIAGIASRPAVVDGKLMFGSDDGVFRALAIGTGAIIWQFETGSADLPSSPLVVDDTVIFGAFDERLYALDVTTGEQRWAIEVGSALSSPVWTGREVVIGAGSTVVAVSPETGELIWRYPTRDMVTDSPIVIDDEVIIQVQGRLLRLASPGR